MILDQIVADKRIEVARRKARVSPVEFRRRAEAAPEARDFAAAVNRDHVALIAEIKRASPSSGEIRTDANPHQIAGIYAENGAAAVSVLTDQKYFHGDLNSLKAARAGCGIPLLRKDFIIDEYQVYESRALQADAILLIVRILDDAQLRAFRLLAKSLGMAALVETHDERELERALKSDAHILGINNRNLDDFSIDLGTTERLGPTVPDGRIVVSESGVRSRADVERAARAGADAVLIGEALMRGEDVGARVREFTGVERVKARVR